MQRAQWHGGTWRMLRSSDDQEDEDDENKDEEPDDGQLALCARLLQHVLNLLLRNSRTLQERWVVQPCSRAQEILPQLAVVGH